MQEARCPQRFENFHIRVALKPDQFYFLNTTSSCTFVIVFSISHCVLAKDSYCKNTNLRYKIYEQMFK